MVIYSMEAMPVEPVFYPVVPDSFMSRESGRPARARKPAQDHRWNEETDTPFLAPQDRWSF